MLTVSKAQLNAMFSRQSVKPVSSATVMVQMRLEPDIGTYSVGSMMMTPKSQSGRVAGTMKLRCRAPDPRGSHMSRLRTWSCSRSRVRIFSNIVAPAGGSTPPVMTSPTSPSAWQPTTDMERMDCISDHLARIEDSLRIERRLDPAHHRDLRRRAAVAEIGALQCSDAVFG